MFTIYTTKEEVTSDYPDVKKWIKTSKKLIEKEVDEDKLEFYYTYGFFHPKVENKEEYYIQMYEKCSKMMFDERLQYELSKVRVNLTMKLGHFIISNRIPKNIIPEAIRDIVSEITKVKMMVESEYHDNQEIKDSIPDIDKSVVSFEIIKDVVKGEYKQSFDIDEILDKIANTGIDSLTQEEKDFLDKKSKEM